MANPTWDETEPAEESIPKWEDTVDVSPEYSPVQSGLMGALQGGTLGFAEEIGGGAKALYDIATTEKELSQLPDLYSKERDILRQEFKKAEAENPAAFMTGNVGAGIGTAFIPGLNVAKGASLAARAGRAATIGGITGLGTSEEETLGGQAADVLGGAVLGGALQAGGEKIAQKLSFDKLKEALKTGAKKVGNIVADVPEEVTEEVIRRGGTQNIVAREADEIANELAAKAAESKATLERFKTAGQKLGEDVKSSFQNVKESLKSKTLEPIRENVLSSIQKLKDDVVLGSVDSYDILSKSDKTFSIKPAIKALQKAQDGLKVDGALVGDTAKKSFQSFQTMIDDLSQLGESELRGPAMKSLLQRLDSDIYKNVDQMATGSFLKEVDQGLRSARRALDEKLKSQVPGYAEKMKEVAEKSNLLGEASQMFGDPQKAMQALNRATTKTGKYAEADVLKKLGEQTGQSFSEAIDEVVKAKDLLSSPSKLDELRSMISKSKGEDQLEMLIKKAAAEDEILSKFPASTVQAKISRYGRGAVRGEPNIGLDQSMQALDELLGKPISQEIKDRAILESFERTGSQGSRRTLGGAIAGKLAGSALGGAAGYAVGEDVGLGAGAMAGFAGDKYAGQIFKKALDVGIKGGNIANRLAQAAPKMGKYAPLLQNAAKRGAHSMAVTHYLLNKSDPNYQAKIKELEEEDKE